MSLLQMAYVPPAEISPEATVRDAVAVALPQGGDAVAVVEEGRLIGVITSRDVMLKVVLRQLAPQDTRVRDVMTTPVVTLHATREPEEALELMLEKNIRHIALTDDDGQLVGMLSLRRLMNFIVQDQRENLLHLEAFLTAEEYTI